MLTAKKRACHRVSGLVQGELAKMNNAIDDRRTANRFPIELPIRFETIGRRKSRECGLGQTINISSTEILFTTDQFLNPGYRVKVAIRWPARLGTTVGLQLVALGRVVWSQQGSAAIEIQHHEFHTCSKTTWGPSLSSGTLPKKNEEHGVATAAGSS
jgi:hypothetical protein